MEDVIQSSKIISSPEPLNHDASLASATTSSPLPPAQQSRTLNGPISILWDMENCPVPNGIRPEDVAGNIRMALRVHPIIKGSVTTFSAYGDFNSFPRRLREGCQRTGVKLVDVPNGRKDAADKAILVDMFLFALDNPPPSSILLISGDVDFAPALHILGQRGYTIILVIPSGVGVSSALSNAGRFVWDWPSMARGEGFSSSKNLMSEAPDVEEESIFYRGIPQSEVYSLKYGSQSLPSGLREVPMGDIEGLKCQLVKLLEMSGGSLPLVRLPADYKKLFGRPLYVAQYGACKLAPLLQKFSDVLIVEGQGQRKFVSLRSSFDRTDRASTSITCFTKKVGSSDEFSDDEKSLCESEQLERFKKEMQELLVCYSCRLVLGNFETLYERRYKKTIDFQSYGVDNLEELIEKVRDVVVLHVDQNSNMKFLVMGDG
ncbi:hypothetical protein QJS04_geneDACA008048 [Acorus gramineus]|uniref:HTH OST-type domain-containing protein n=1 Tax=Acorus gramineus TaxID=55184 RepID=A0AAV9BDK1_ACOGR|nr:hypothetical protein QJS04_geneDACA008048 [Acorus gramineus]